MSTKSQNLILLFGITTLILILSLCFFTFKSGDDYDFITNVTSRGIIQNCIKLYNEWDGRFLSITSVIQGLMLVYLPIELVTFIWNICFFINGFLIFIIVKSEVELNIKNIKMQIITICTIIIVSWLGAIRHFSDTIYWGTGGVYTLALLFGTIYILVFLNFQKKKKKIFAILIFGFCSFLVGCLTQNLTIPIQLLVIMTIFSDVFTKQKKYHFQNFFFLSFLFLGLLVVTFAPGSKVRLTVCNPETSSMLQLIYNFFLVLAKYLYRSIFLIIFAFVGAIAVFLMQTPKVKMHLTNIFKFQTFNLLQFVKNTKWFVIALSTITPFVVIPDLVSQRTTIYFINFFCIFLFISIFKILEKYTSRTNYSNPNKNINISKVLFALLFIFTIIFVAYNLKMGYNLKSEITSRENILKSSKNKTIFLKIIDVNKIPICYNFTDYPFLQTDNSDFVRKFQEKYYGVKIIAVK